MNECVEKSITTFTVSIESVWDFKTSLHINHHEEIYNMDIAAFKQKAKKLFSIYSNVSLPTHTNIQCLSQSNNVLRYIFLCTIVMYLRSDEGFFFILQPLSF